MSVQRLNIYEINTITWLQRLGRSLGGQVDLSEVPPGIWDTLAEQGFNAVWLMGVWERSPAARAINESDPAFNADMRQVLPNFNPGRDLAGSAYSIKDYQVSTELGGREGLFKVRQNLNQRGLKLIIDFVPNHVAPDHPWTASHPEYFINASESDLAADPSAYLKLGDRIFARGRDPTLDPWSDVVQLNVFEPGLRRADIELLRNCAELADGVRCDMAMLLINRIFSQTWGERAGEAPPAEYWAELILSVRQRHPNMLFIAESYWGTQDELLKLGFDYCYDKEFLDLLLDRDVSGLHSSLFQDVSIQEHLIRFLENHDEQRAAAAFPVRLQRLSALLVATLPSQKLYFDGQLEGLKIRTPVHLRRDPVQAADSSVKRYYGELLKLALSICSASTGFKLLPVEVAQIRGKGLVLCWAWDNDGRHYFAGANFSNHRLTLKPALEQSIPGVELIFQTSSRRVDLWQQRGKPIFSLGSLEGAVFELK